MRTERGDAMLEFGGAVLFVVGSILFFSDATQTGGAWCFLIGSALLAVPPGRKLILGVRARDD
ncbi:MAG: YrhK family protein [Rubricella sp.]